MLGSTMPYLLVQVSVGSEMQAWTIARAVVERSLAAAAQVLPMRSCYNWKGRLTESNEYLVLIKSGAAAYDAIEACVKELHSYEVPAIVALPIIAGSAPYLRWIDECVKL
jgi:periplasmic divalent cation tolerance protein